MGRIWTPNPEVNQQRDFRRAVLSQMRAEGVRSAKDARRWLEANTGMTRPPRIGTSEADAERIARARLRREKRQKARPNARIGEAHALTRKAPRLVLPD